MDGYKMMTAEEAEAAREERRNEAGKEPPCPWCQRPRVKRSDYIRCLPCGVNWLLSEMHLTYKGKPYLSVDPRLSRQEAAHMGSTTRPTVEQKAGGAE